MVALNTHFYRDIILVIGTKYVNKESQDFRYTWHRVFRTEVLSEWWKNMSKLLPCIFQQCLADFKILTVLRCTETRLFRHLGNHVFRSLKLGKYLNHEPHPFFQNVQHLLETSEMQKEIAETFSISGILAFKVVAPNIHF